MTHFMKKPTEEKPCHDGIQRLYFFPNGYGASVIRHKYSYGNEDGNWELGVIKGNPEDWKLCYSTPITEDVEGNVTDEQVDAILTQIEALQPTP